MYWNLSFAYRSSLAKEINRNMRCIEMLRTQGTNTDKDTD